MAFVHGRTAYVSIDSNDISEFCNDIKFNRSSDSHDTTTFGKNSKTYQGGLLDGTCTLSGIYDSGMTGPRTVIDPLLGTVVELEYRVEGTGTGKPADTVDVLVTAYEESAAVADMVMWSATLQMSDDVATAAQV